MLDGLLMKNISIKRDSYLQQLIDYRFNGQVKVITGIRRCGKSYLLKILYKDYLLSTGLKEEQLIIIELDLVKDLKYRDPLVLASYVREIVANKSEPFYLFVDEIQMADVVNNPYNPDGKKITFYDALNDLRSLTNLDIYVTGSNSKMLSTDILTEFRGRSDEIRVHPLSFAEYYAYVGGDKNTAFADYALFGGMPFILSRPNEESKIQYLQSLVVEVYLKDIVERNKLTKPEMLEQVVNLLCSAIGSLTNPAQITNILQAQQNERVASNTIRSYLNHLVDAFVVSECKRYDVKGKSYLDSTLKYYCEDVGLRNARLEFRQQEMAHIMENIIYNELVRRKFSVAVGIVYTKTPNASGNYVKTAREIDFVINKGNRRFYIQSAYSLSTEEIRAAELKPFTHLNDCFSRIVIRSDVERRWYDETGVLHINVIDFLLDQDLLK